MIPGDPHAERDSGALGGLAGARRGAPSAPAFAALVGVASGVAVVLVIFAGGYGYHRDDCTSSRQATTWRGVMQIKAR